MELFNARAEQAVIGALMQTPDDIHKVEFLNGTMFADEAHQNIFKAIAGLESKNKPVDVITVAELLEKHNRLESAGGLKYITELVQASLGSINLLRHAEIIHEKAQLRNLLQTLRNARTQAEEGKDIGEVIAEACTHLEMSLNGIVSDEPKRVSALLEDRFDRIDKLQLGELKPLLTGFDQFDEKFNGLHGGDLVILAGRPSMGKTALGVQIAEQMQSKEKPALVFSCEMSNGQLVDRMITGNSRVSSARLFREGAMQDDDWERLTAIVPKIQELNLFVDDTANTLAQIRTRARAVKRKHGLGLVVIDYLQLMSEQQGKNGNREQEISAISRGLKALAKELDVPIVALSQLSRKVEERADKRPLMSDLRESGALEQDADLIIFVYRDEYYNPDTPYKGSAEIICAKNRNGETGKIFLTFDGEFTRFKSHVGQEPSYEPQKTGRYNQGFND